MELMEACVDRAEYLVQESEQAPLPNTTKAHAAVKWKSFRQKIHDSYSRALKYFEADAPVRSTSNFLTDFEGMRILINLFPASDGYCVTLLGNGGSSPENLHIGYEEYEVLDYIDNEQLPPVLSNLLHRNHSPIFTGGSVLVEIRDYRISSDKHSFEMQHVLLKPTQQTLNKDINILTQDMNSSFKWTQDDKLALESTLTLATAEPLCLETSPTVAIIKNKMQRSINLERKTIKRKSFIQRKSHIRKAHHVPSSLELHSFLLKHRNGGKDIPTISPDIKLPKRIVDVWRKTPLALSAPLKIDISPFANVFAPVVDDVKNEDIIEVQSICFESESGNRDVVSRITIGQRPRDMHYFGMLQSNKYLKQNIMNIKDTNQIFSLGTERRASLYILQYQELFTEDGRRPAKVTSRHANKPPVVYQVPNQQQPWQLAHEKSVYTVGSVMNIPSNKWKKMNLPILPDLMLKKQAASYHKQKVLLKHQHHTVSAFPVQFSSNPPSINSVCQQNLSPAVFSFQSKVVSGQYATKSVPSFGSEIGTGTSTNKLGIIPHTQTTVGAEIITRNIAGGNSQKFAMNSPAYATALTQIGGTRTVSVQVPVMAVSSQKGTSGPEYIQGQGQPATAVIRMPVGITSGTSSSGQLTAALNLINGGQNVLGNIQLTGGAGITIPASQLPANITMQLASIANANAQQISLVAASNGQSVVAQPHEVTMLDQPVANAPFAIIASNGSSQTEEGISSTNQVKMQILSPTTRSGQGQQPHVQLCVRNQARAVSGSYSNNPLVLGPMKATMKPCKTRVMTPD